MLSIWYTVLCVLAVGTTAGTVNSKRNLEEGEPGKPGSKSKSTMPGEWSKAIFKRAATSLHDYDLSHSIVNTPLLSDSIEGISLSLNCVSCQTFGTAQVSSSGIDRNASFFSDVATLAEVAKDDGLSAAVADAVDLNISVDFLNTSAKFNFGANFSASESHTFNLLTLPVVALATPIDGAKDNVGIVLLLDLILNANGAAEFEGGFDVTLGDNAKIVLDPLGGKILSTSFPGLKFNALPVTVNDPKLVFTASLRATLEVGTTITVDLVVDDVGVSFEAGVFVDLVTYSANVTDVAGNFTLGKGKSSNSTVVSNSTLVSTTTTVFATATKFVGVTATKVVAATANPTGGSALSGIMNITAPYPVLNVTRAAGNGTAGNTTCTGAILKEELSLDVGAFAEASANITLGGQGFDFNKAVTTTLVALALPTVCL